MDVLGLHCCPRAFCSTGEGGYFSLQSLGFSWWWLLLLQSTGSQAQARQLWRQALLLLGLWGLPGPGIEPMSPALTDRLSTTGPPGKSIKVFLKRSEKKSFIPGFQQFIYDVASHDFLKGYSIQSLRGLIQWIIVLIKVGKSGRLFFSFSLFTLGLLIIYIYRTI